jgi:hypothetical protein
MLAQRDRRALAVTIAGEHRPIVTTVGFPL